MTLQTVIKSGLSPVLRSLYGRRSGMAEGRRVILCFHSVHPTRRHSSIRPDDFDRIMSWLAGNVDLMPVEQLLECERGTNPKPAVALTFDDGHRDNLTHALPIVRNYGVTFCVYVVVGLLESDERTRQRFATLLRLPKDSVDGYEALSWDEAAKLLGQGCMIGSHTWDHPMLSQLDDRGIECQLSGSKRLIEERLGLKRIGIAYPYGKLKRNVDARATRAAEELGYVYGLCVEHRAISPADSLFAIPRIIINHADTDRLREQLFGGEDYHGAISRVMPTFVAKRVSPDDFHEPADAIPPIDHSEFE